MTIIPNSHQLARELSFKYKIGLLSNVYLRTFEKTFEKGFIPRLEYSAIIKSCDWGVIKPEKEIYELAHEKTKVKAEKILLIDDYQQNIKEAKKQGRECFFLN